MYLAEGSIDAAFRFLERAERAKCLVHFAPSGQRDLVCGYPGRRFALPWASLLKSVGLEPLHPTLILSCHTALARLSQITYAALQK